MLGRSHVATGAAGFLGLATPGFALAGNPLSPGEIACGTLVAAGAALLPDLDHPQATVSRSLGPISWFASRVITKLAGGHRNGTHSALAAFLVLIAALAAVASGGLIGPFITCVICVSLVCRLFLDGFNDATSAIVACVVSAGLLAVTPDFRWIPLAVAGGYILHLAGDAITKEGVPLLWPVNKTRFRFGLILTGGRLEKIVCLGSGLTVAILAWTMILAPAIAQTHP
ncbi:metal-dependent hydrolase [Miltoncostaea oceani]|uniref:metal-dependent hydrolase n=1 Tax=Miltoncostaea oceani TaxID=2843216 RepID=UPI001C3E5187|nr:metal-dependent hydrolase [Miltoncostaea oceani]